MRYPKNSESLAKDVFKDVKSAKANLGCNFQTGSHRLTVSGEGDLFVSDSIAILLLGALGKNRIRVWVTAVSYCALVMGTHNAAKLGVSLFEFP